MRRFNVFDAEGHEIGYLILESQVFYPYTKDDEDLHKGFFNQTHSEEYLRNFVLSKKPEKSFNDLSSKL